MSMVKAKPISACYMYILSYLIGTDYTSRSGNSFDVLIFGLFTLSALPLAGGLRAGWFAFNCFILFCSLWLKPFFSTFSTLWNVPQSYVCVGNGYVFMKKLTKYHISKQEHTHMKLTFISGAKYMYLK